MNNPKISRLFIHHGYALFEGLIPDSSEHQHHALEIFIGLEGPVKLISRQSVHRGQILLMDANTLHRVPGPADRKVILIFDPESVVAASLKERFLMTTAIVDLSDQIDAPSIIKFLLETGSDLPIPAMYRHVITQLRVTEQPVATPDERIRNVQLYLRSLNTKKASLADIAEQVHLSEGRLVHLFKEQVGIPLRRYQLWLRLIDSITYILQGYSLTASAHQAGFSDYAHLSRTFAQMFGYSLADIFKNRMAIEIISTNEW
jgi:AraC-like DNA-binding protein